MSKKVLLLNDVESLGRKGDIASAKEGYIFNFLIPKGLAMIATPYALRKQKKLQEERQVVAAHDRKEAEEMAAKLNDETLAFTVKVDHEGHMYGSVSALDIVHLIKMQTGIDLDKRFVLLKHPIKETGVTTLKLRLKEDVDCSIQVKILPEEHVEK